VESLSEQTVGAFLERLSARVPAPGGGASAALHAAQAAALLGMVARYSDGEPYAEHADEIAAVLAHADELRERSLALADADAAAFARVGEAYKLPREGDAERDARDAAIAEALVGAARPPADVVEVAARLVALAERLRPIGNPNVVTDVAAAADAARAAATTARVNVEINVGGIRDEAVRSELTAAVARVDELAARADDVTAAVRRAIAP
jgi:formiminotetrahydrofolate cyclodeaminase